MLFLLHATENGNASFHRSLSPAPQQDWGQWVVSACCAGTPLHGGGAGSHVSGEKAADLRDVLHFRLQT